MGLSRELMLSVPFQGCQQVAGGELSLPLQLPGAGLRCETVQANGLVLPQPTHTFMSLSFLDHNKKLGTWSSLRSLLKNHK